MRQLYPRRRELELDDVYAGLTLDAGDERAHLAVNMVSTVDGAATLDGRAGGLGGPADLLAFRRLRAACDAILVGAGTVRVENYGPGQGSDEARADRVRRGLAPAPRLVVVSRSLDLPTTLRIFEDPAARPLVVTGGAGPAARAATLHEVAEILVCGGETDVDLQRLLSELADRGLRRVLCEGGPTLNAGLLADDLIDELFVTFAPALVGGDASRIVAPYAGDEMAGTSTRRLSLAEVHEHDGELLLRYRRGGAAGEL